MNQIPDLHNDKINERTIYILEKCSCAISKYSRIVIVDLKDWYCVSFMYYDTY